MRKNGPKAYKENITFVDKPYGNAQRRGYYDTIFKDAPIFPKPLEYDDIDKAFFAFVDKEIPLAIDGKEVPTFTLYSSQRFSEYSQTWEHTDADNNLLMNFKTVNRDNNPKIGSHQGGLWNIPGDRHYTLLMRDVLEDDGKESYEIYSMKQPFTVDLTYKINFVTNKLENLNTFNIRINDLFKARQAYIRPNGHFIPMTVEEVNDETQYSIEDRKFYVQSISVKAMAYIIDKDSFKVEKRPKNIKYYLDEGNNKKKKVNVDIEEYDDENLENRQLEIDINFEAFHDKVEFTIDTDAVIECCETENIRTIRLSVNKTPTYIAKGFKLKDGDDVRIRIIPLLVENESKIVFKGYNPNVIVDLNETSEFVSEQPDTYEEITID